MVGTEDAPVSSRVMGLRSDIGHEISLIAWLRAALGCVGAWRDRLSAGYAVPFYNRFLSASVQITPLLFNSVGPEQRESIIDDGVLRPEVEN